MAADASLERFVAYEREKTRRAISASIPSVATLMDRSHYFDVEAIAHPVIEQFWGGPFHHSRADDSLEIPVTNLVFVQDANGNTGSEEPESLGGGGLDLMVYELASRVYVDAVIAGSATVGSPADPEGVVLSVWHPEGVDLRMHTFGKRRHPINVVATEQGDLFVEEGLVYNNPDVEVVILTGDRGGSRLAPRLEHRSWVHIERTGERPDLRRGFTILREKYGVAFASAVGGRRVATELLDLNLVHDLYLTTTPIVAVSPEPPTPFYLGDPLRLRQRLDLVVRKSAQSPGGEIYSEYHRVVSGEGRAGFRAA